MSQSQSARRVRLDVQKHLDTMLDKLRSRLSIVDSGDWSGYPIEGLCWLRIESLEDGLADDDDEETPAKALWPAWLYARGTEQWSGEAVERDDWTRVVSCYGSGWTVQVNITELIPYDAHEPSSAGGKLYTAALREAKARVALAEAGAKENENFENLVAQNLELCTEPVLLGRVYQKHLERAKRQPRPREMLAIRWNDNDWWPARVISGLNEVNGETIASAPDGTDARLCVDVVYDDDDETHEQIVRGSDVWRDDVRCLGDDSAPDYDALDVSLLLGTEFELQPVDEASSSSKKKQQQPQKKKKQSTTTTTTVFKDESEMPELPVPQDDDDEAYHGPAFKAHNDDDSDDDDLDIMDLDLDNLLETTKDLPALPPLTTTTTTTTTQRKRKSSDGGEKKKKKKPREKAFPDREERQALLEAATHRWSVSKGGRVVGGTGVALAKKNGDKPPPPKKKRAPAVKKPAAPSFLSLLTAGPKTSAPPKKVPTPKREKAFDAAANIAAVDRAVLAAQEREARLMDAELPPDRTQDELPPKQQQQPDESSSEHQPPTVAVPVAPPPVAPPPPAPREPSRASVPLPRGWVAKWSERKQMYYYAHKTKRLTRWTPPRTTDDGPDNNANAPAPPRPPKPTSSPRAVTKDDDDEVPYYTGNPFKGQDAAPKEAPKEAPKALDAARRTMAALEARITDPRPVERPRPPPAVDPPPPVPFQQQRGGFGAPWMRQENAQPARGMLPARSAPPPQQTPYGRAFSSSSSSAYPPPPQQQQQQGYPQYPVARHPYHQQQQQPQQPPQGHGGYGGGFQQQQRSQYR